MIPKSALSIAATSAGICFIGFCVYVNRKRRSLREKRRQLPDLSNPEVKRIFVTQEFQIGEELLAGGDIEGGVEHLSYAIAASDHPDQILPVLRNALPPQIFALLVEKLSTVGQRISGLSPGVLLRPSPRPAHAAFLAEE